VSNAAITQCPHCRAKFRVRSEQARAHGGLVRCGACRGIFDARAHLIEGSLEVGDERDDSDLFAGPQTVVAGLPPVTRTPSDEEIRVAARAAVAKTAHAAYETDLAIESARRDTAPAADRPADASLTHAERTDYDWRAPAAPLTRGQKLAYGTLALLVLLVFIAQSAYWFRDDIASRFPAVAPKLAAACAQLGCRVSPPRRPDALGFVGSELAADPAHKGLHIFSATLRNTSGSPVAFPSLVLTFEGVGGEPIARGVFSPVQYAPANANLARGLEAGSDLEVKLYLDVSPATPVGFKADHAYF
jgi:predicted Zn finger-like uncharacterized protein